MSFSLTTCLTIVHLTAGLCCFNMVDWCVVRPTDSIFNSQMHKEREMSFIAFSFIIVVSSFSMVFAQFGPSLCGYRSTSKIRRTRVLFFSSASIIDFFFIFLLTTGLLDLECNYWMLIYGFGVFNCGSQTLMNKKSQLIIMLLSVLISLGLLFITLRYYCRWVPVWLLLLVKHKNIRVTLISERDWVNRDWILLEMQEFGK